MTINLTKHLLSVPFSNHCTTLLLPFASIHYSTPFDDNGFISISNIIDVDSVKRKLTEMRDAQKEENAKMLTRHATSYSFGDLKQLAVLGSGTFGKVTLVQHKTEKDPTTRMGKVYALKAMLKSEIVQHKQQENVMQEKATMIVCSHPFILKLYQTFKDQYHLYMLLGTYPCCSCLSP